MLSAFVAENQQDWDLKIPYVMMAYRSAVQESTQVTPYAMMFGDEIPVPLDWVFRKPKNTQEDRVLYVRDLRTMINASYEFARKSMLSAVRRQKRTYDKDVRNVVFEVGQFVMCHDKTKKVGRNPALRPKWRGPYVIIRMDNPATAVIKLEAKKAPLTVHVDRLKHCFPPKRSKYKWAETLLKESYPELTINFRDDDLPSASEDSDSAGAEVPKGAPAEAGESDIGEGSGMSSLAETTDNSEVDDATLVGLESGAERSPAGERRQPRRRPATQRKRAQNPNTVVRGPKRQRRELGEPSKPSKKGAGPRKKPKMEHSGSAASDTSDEAAPDPPVVHTKGGRTVKPPQRYGWA
jgi:hypothetical protein